MFSLFSLLTGLAILPNLSAAQNSTTLKCYNARFKGVDGSHCHRALQNIVYDSNGRLDGLSKVLFVWHQSCVINIQKPVSLQPNRQWIESTVQAITQRCQSSGGIQTFPQGIVAQVYRSTDTNVYQIGQPVCEKRRCNYRMNDCIMAMNQLAVDHKGNFVVQSSTQRYAQTEATWGNCTALVRTTDASAFRISHVEANPAFKRVLNHCGSRPGTIYVSGGTEGNNGDVMLAVRGSSC